MGKKYKEGWVVAIFHFLFSGILGVMAALLIGLVVFLFGLGAEGITRAFVAILGKTAQDFFATFSYALLGWEIVLTVLTTIGFYWGIRWSSEFIEKRFLVNDRKRVILFATLYLISEHIVISFFGTYFTTTQIFITLLNIVLAAVIFYFLSHKYFLVVLEHQKNIQQILPALFTIVVFIALYFLGSFIGQRLTEPVGSRVQRIYLIPMGNTTITDLQKFEEILQKELPKIEISFGEAIKVPVDALNIKRNQWDANIIFNNFEKGYNTETTSRYIAIFDKDMFIAIFPEINYIFATTKPKSNSILLSTYRLKMINQGSLPHIDDLLFLRYKKTVLRALGLTFGFSPSKDRNCVMAFSNSIEELDQKGSSWCGNEVELIKKIQEISVYPDLKVSSIAALVNGL